LEDGLTQPTPPVPDSFGIDARYYERAIEGARGWARDKSLPSALKWGIRVVVFLLPGAFVILQDGWPAAFGLCLALIVVTLGIGQGAIAVIERVRGSRLQRTIYDPQYNPNPEAYRKYAAAYAEYESQLSEVFLSSHWIYHSISYCCGMRYPWTLPKWRAVVKGAKPCINCGHLATPRPGRELPRPFGKAYLPEELMAFKRADEEREKRLEEAQERMAANAAEIAARIQRNQQRRR
jgi:hypothetical protein